MSFDHDLRLYEEKAKEAQKAIGDLEFAIAATSSLTERMHLKLCLEHQRTWLALYDRTVEFLTRCIDASHPAHEQQDAKDLSEDAGRAGVTERGSQPVDPPLT